MRIDPNNSIDQVYSSTMRPKAAGQEEQAQAVEAQKNLPQDKVELSSKAAGYDPVEALKEEAVNDAEKGTRAERLRQLKTEIESGAYYVSGRDIADAILNFGKSND